MRNLVHPGAVGILCTGFLLASLSVCAAASSTKSDEEKAFAALESELSLTQEQKDKLKAMREELRAKNITISADLRAAKNSLQKELDSPDPDRKKADNLVATINKLQAQTLASRVDHVFAMRAILAPEQYQKLLQARDKRRQQMKAKVQQGKAAQPPAKSKPAGKKEKK
jgi:Spy/CpxP family protein refolding chaperone